MSMPQDLKYTESHEWVRLEGDIATVGITQVAVDQLTDLVYVDLPAAGIEVQARRPFGEIESVKAVSELISPVSGKVVETNDAVSGDPTVISGDPYGAGWLIKISLTDPAELDNLLDAGAYGGTLDK